ncbi:MAG TPA: DNA adenine methylase [Terriglobales bacterium]|jgi:DNA adenine methylase|nr:DNA adenine methylase [Terriglobales bacterium]
MRTINPLRYPGGKAFLAPTLAALLQANRLVRPTIAEPYAGAAGASLELLFGEYVQSILINDFDYRVFSFWWAALNHTDQFVQRIRSIRLTIPEWKRQRDIYRNARRHKRFDVGFATFFLNRTNRSGILVNGGPIGGIKQTGEWGIDARFTRATLADRVDRIGAYRERILISNLDALEFIQRLGNGSPSSQLFLYLDPPYYEKGADLYLSTYGHDDHVAVSKALRSGKHQWAATYDDVPAIRAIYAKCRIVPFKLRYTAHHSRPGKELLILPKELAVPESLKFAGHLKG